MRTSAEDRYWTSVVYVLSFVRRRKIAPAWTRREYSERLSHWNIEGRRKFGCKSQRGALDGGPAEGCARERGTTHRIAPQCTASASALQPCSIRYRVRARAICVYTESCKCDAYAMLVWPMTSSALPMTFTATTPCSCSSDVHPGQASTSLITKDSVNDPANYIFRAGWARQRARWPHT